MNDINSLAEELKQAELNLKAILHEDGGVYSRTKWTVSECKVKIFDALTADIPLDRLREICAAERDGRCVVLLCKVGDSVWDRFGYHWTITQIEHHAAGRIWFRCGNKGTDDYTAFSDDAIGESIFLQESEGNAAKERWEKECAAITSEAALNEQDERQEPLFTITKGANGNCSMDIAALKGAKP